ncbi:hypothetical protein EGK75_09295 [Neisseria weixii]|uniref:Uncharacterized protein n=1 Tax=Neisseria weixii TaxID=1853276 RepID=A0A3N4N728_9NEIS|nr:hypothetical protein [Neisseria weixii]RPD86305.1 hypothetical protein EGK75_09295 [Neisseria weixii]RPD89376.1 hypothetical protein EGK74_03925 [Neisseria weixii]
MKPTHLKKTEIAEIKILEKDGNGKITSFAFRRKGERKWIKNPVADSADLVAFMAVYGMLTQ